VAEYDHAVAHAAREDARSNRLMQLPGIGPTTASALLASLGGAHEFDNGRQVAAWIGLTPGQHSSVNGDSKLIHPGHFLCAVGVAGREGRRPDRKAAPSARCSTVRYLLPDLNHAGLALVLQSVAFPGHRHDARMMQQAIEQGGGQRRVLGESRIPLPERQIAGDDQ
jgi:hypothetical protein